MKLPRIRNLLSERAVSLLRKPGKEGAAARRLFRATCVLGGVVLALTVMTYVLSEVRNDYTERRNQLVGGVAQMASDIAQTQMKLSKAEKAMPTFSSEFGNAQKPEISLDRQRAAELIERLKEQHLFASLRVSMSPVKDLEDARFKNRLFTGQYCEMLISAEGLSDEHVFQFLDQLDHELPGRLKIESLKVSRIAEPIPQMMALIAKSGRVGLVRADIKILWMGVKPGAAGAAAIPPPPPGEM